LADPAGPDCLITPSDCAWPIARPITRLKPLYWRILPIQIA
jgi:hypothetical protein